MHSPYGFHWRCVVHICCWHNLCRSSCKTYFPDQFSLLPLFECSIIFNNWVLFGGGSVRARYSIQNDLYAADPEQKRILFGARKWIFFFWAKDVNRAHFYHLSTVCQNKSSWMVGPVAHHFSCVLSHSSFTVCNVATCVLRTYCCCSSNNLFCISFKLARHLHRIQNEATENMEQKVQFSLSRSNANTSKTDISSYLLFNYVRIISSIHFRRMRVHWCCPDTGESQFKLIYEPVRKS